MISRAPIAGYSFIPISFKNKSLTNCDASSKIYLTSLEDYAFNIRLLFLQLITFSVPHLFGLKCVSNLLDNIFACILKLLLQSKNKTKHFYIRCVVHN